jgi:hypothetical protein
MTIGKRARVLVILLAVVGMAFAAMTAAPQRALAASCAVSSTSGDDVYLPAGLTCYNIASIFHAAEASG